MLHLLGSRLSVPQRVLLIAACAAPPVVLLLFLFVRQTEREYRFTAEELKGAAYIGQIWPVIVSGGDARLPARTFGAETQARAFASAPSGARAARGADLLQAVADGSNLTLDTDLGSFYAMDAATVGLPRLLAAVTSPGAAKPDAFTLGRAQALEEAALRDLDEAIDRDRTGKAAAVLSGQPAAIRSAFDGFLRQSGDPAARAQLVSAVDRAWRADDRELRRLLEARQALTRERLLVSLGLVVLTLMAATALAAAMTRDMTGQLQALLDAVDRLNAGDTDTSIPFLNDATEAGRIAGTLEAFRLGLIDTEAERRRVEETAAAVRENEARYRMLADNASDLILQYDAEFRLIYVSPSVREFGYTPEEVLGLEPLYSVHPDDIELVVQRRELAIQGVDARSLAIRLRHADGRWIWMEGILTVVRDATGAIAGFISSFRNIHERTLAEQALIDSEARYRMLADNASDIILHYDREFRPLYISPSVAQLGYEPLGLQGWNLQALVHPDDLDAIEARRAEAMAGALVRPIAARIRKADNRWVWFESTMTPVVDENGVISGFVSALRDISERRAAEQAVIDSEARYRMLAENISDVLLRYDADFKIQYVSPSVRQWGYVPEDFVGQIAGVFVHPDDQERVALRRAAMMTGERIEAVEARIRKSDGTWTWIESNPALIRDENGAALGMVLVLRDINQRKAAEAALVDSEIRYRMLADNTSDIIQRFNAEGIVEYMSPSVRQLGYEPEYFLGRPIAQLVDSQDKEAVMRRREDLLSGRPVPPLESRTHSADGRTVWLESRPSPILDAQGKLLGVVNVMRDVTARKNAETAMQELSLELRRVARASALGAFAGSLAHEINQPLAAASVSGEAALRWFSVEPPNYERGLLATRRMVEDVRRAADVVGRMRALVTKEALRNDRFDAHEALREVMALIALECERSSVTTRIELRADDPWMRGDRVLFQQVMINLMLNAIEAMRAVEEDRLLLVRSGQAGGSLEFQVEDRGPGIDPDKQSRIFESMFTTKVGGTGLGLAISKSIVEDHGGAISVEPASPRGALFSVRIPVDVPAATAEV